MGSTEEDTLPSVAGYAGALTLKEYDSKTVRLSEEQAGELNLAGGGKYLGIEPEGAAGQWRVTANHYIGSINVAGLQVLVRPKIPLRNLFLLLEVGLRERDWHDEAVRFETTGDLLPALVSFFRPYDRDHPRPRAVPLLPGAARPARCASRPCRHRPPTRPARRPHTHGLQVHRVHRRPDRELVSEGGRVSITARRPSAGHR